jgi:ketosteroid isomerase-like protein
VTCGRLSASPTAERWPIASRSDIIRSIYERWNSGDTALEAFAPDIEWLMPYPDARGRGKEAMQAAIGEYLRAWSDYELTVDDVRELDEDRALVLFTERVRGRHSDIERYGESAALWVFRDGLVVRFEGWLHRPDAYASLGIEP